MLASLAALTLFAPVPGVVPKPVELRPLATRFVLKRGTTSIVAPAGLAEARHLQSYLQRNGFAIDVAESAKWGSRFVFKPSPKSAKLPPEGYSLNIGPNAVDITYADSAGAFYAVQTIRQLFDAKIESRSDDAKKSWSLPGVRVRDYPRFTWRGMHLDVSRHFYSTEFIKRYIDWLAMMKMNVFHWHLVDDGGWRMEVERYPKLTSIGAWRIDTGGKWPGGDWNYANLRFCMTPEDGPRYGGYYTKAEMRDVVRYAAERHVDVVPEIEMPGHSLPAIVAYPELGCEGAKPVERGQAATNSYCPGRTESFRFLEGVLTETLATFPSQYIHIGADEVRKDDWEKCRLCQAKRKELGLKSMDELQSWFVRHFDEWLRAKGRRLVGWDEILEGGLADGATVMSWRGTEGGIEAAKQGKNVVMSPTSHCYFDYSYKSTPTEKVYAWDPVPPVLNPTEAKRVLGGQANVWTEFIPTEERVQEMIFPRAFATAEVLWSPKAGRSFAEFKPRLAQQLMRLRLAGIDYHVGVPEVDYDFAILSDGLEIKAGGDSASGDPLRYTLDGSDPTANSPAYRAPIPVGKPKVIKFAYVSTSGKVGDVRRVNVVEPLFLPMVVRSPGLKTEWFEGTFEQLSTAKPSVPYETGTVADIDSLQPPTSTNFMVRATGVFRAERAGTYGFWLTSDDGSRMLLADTLMLDNDGPHAMVTVAATALLPAGDYPLQIEWSQVGGAMGLQWEYQPPGGKRQRVPASFLTH